LALLETNAGSFGFVFRDELDASRFKGLLNFPDRFGSA
jgi:hypothetical protein